MACTLANATTVALEPFTIPVVPLPLADVEPLPAGEGVPEPEAGAPVVEDAVPPVDVAGAPVVAEPVVEAVEPVVAVVAPPVEDEPESVVGEE